MAENYNSNKSRNFILEGIDQRLLFGQNDVYLRIIETSFESQIVARGDKLIIDGNPDDVDKIVFGGQVNCFFG